MRYGLIKIRSASLLLFGLFWVFDVETSEWVGDIARSLLVLSTNVLSLHFVSEVRPEVVRDISRTRDQLELFSLSEEERNIIFCSPFTYPCPVRSRRRDCSRKVKDGWFVSLIFFHFWASGKLMFCCRNPNSRRATISYFGLLHSRKLIETGIRVSAFVKPYFWANCFL